MTESRTPARRPKARRIVCKPRVLGGKPVIEGTRMSVDQILGLISKGMSIERIVRSYPPLTVSDVRAAVAHAQEALRHRIANETAPGRRPRNPD